jgi:RND family efflux transporter MFP subunit
VNLTTARLFPILAFAAVVFSGCSKEAAGDSAVNGDSAQAAEEDGDNSAPDVRLPVVAEEARDGDLILHVNTSGRVRSRAASRVTVEVTGAVDAVLVKPGDRVRAGQALVRLDPRPFDLAVREAQHELDLAQLRYTEEIVPESLATGRPPTPERRASALLKAGVEGARVRLERAKLDQERSVIRAPFNGRVEDVLVAAGERVNAGTPVTTVIDVNDVWVEASVLEHDLPLIKEGASAIVVTAGARGIEAEGRVFAVLPGVDTVSRAGRALVRVNGDAVLRPGMYADVRLEATRLTNRRLVPARAIIERDGRPLVFVVKDGRAQWVYVNPGRSNGRETEILPDEATGIIPVEPGDKVIVDGHLTLTHDAPVRVVSGGGDES